MDLRPSEWRSMEVPPTKTCVKGWWTCGHHWVEFEFRVPDAGCVTQNGNCRCSSSRLIASRSEQAQAMSFRRHDTYHCWELEKCITIIMEKDEVVDDGWWWGSRGEDPDPNRSLAQKGGTDLGDFHQMSSTMKISSYIKEREKKRRI